MNRSGRKNDYWDEFKALFICGQLLGAATWINRRVSKSDIENPFMKLLSQLDVDVLERFLKSDRSRDKQDPFRYRKECEELIRFHRRVFPKRHLSGKSSKTKTKSRSCSGSKHDSGTVS